MHDFCLLLGYGADAICPYLVFEMLANMRCHGVLDLHISDQQIYRDYVAACARGIAKVMAKMGISTLQSYKVKTGAEDFLRLFQILYNLIWEDEVAVTR